jgi:putative drug exporter of the RND superfamily
MPIVSLRSMVTDRPGWVVVFWVALACAMGLLAPNLTRLAAEVQAGLLGGDAESLRAAEVLRRAWPDLAV